MFLFFYRNLSFLIYELNISNVSISNETSQGTRTRCHFLVRNQRQHDTFVQQDPPVLDQELVTKDEIPRITSIMVGMGDKEIRFVEGETLDQSETERDDPAFFESLTIGI